MEQLIVTFSQTTSHIRHNLVDLRLDPHDAGMHLVPRGLPPVNGEWGSMPLVMAGPSSDNNVIMTNDFNFIPFSNSS